MKALSAGLFFLLFFITVHAQETVKAIVLKDFPPEYSLDSEGRPTGFAIDMIEEVAKIADVKLEFIVVENWNESNRLFFEQGIGDIVPNSGITPERLKKALFTTPMETISVRAFRRALSTHIQTLSDLDNLKVAVARNNSAHVLLQQRPNVQIETYDSEKLAFNGLVAGEVDAFVFPEIPVETLIREYGLAGIIVPFGEPVSEIKRGICIQKSRPDLAQKLDRALKELLHSPKYLEIYHKWYDHVLKNYREINLIESAAQPDYPPFSISTAKGEAEGFAVELFKAALQNMGKEVHFQVDHWHTIKKRLAQGQIDALPMMGRTLEREKQFDFSFPFMQIFGALIVRNDDDTIHTLDDIQDKRLIVLQDGTAAAFIRRNHIQTHLIPAKTYKEAMERLSSGEGNAVLVQKYVGAELLKHPDFSHLKMVQEPVKAYRQDFCFAVRKNNHELLAILNEGLAITRADGTYERLHQKWFPSLYEKKVDSTLFYFLLGTLGVALIALIVVWLWQKALSQKVKEKTFELEQSNRRWHDMFYRHDGIMILVDPNQNGKIIEVNDAALQYYGYTHDEITRLSIQEINTLTPMEVQQEMEKAKRLKRNHFEFRHRLKNGEIRDVEVHSTPIQTPEGSFLFSIIHDVTDRKEMEHTLKKQEQSLRTIVDYAPQGMVVVDSSMMVLAYNSMCYELFGLPSSTYRIGRHFSGILKDWADHTEQSEEMYQLALKELHKEEHFEFDFPQSVQGEERWCHLTHTPLPNGGFVRTFTDITPLKQMEENLKKLNENLESKVTEELEKNRQQEQLLIHQARFAAIGEMIGAIAHQWRQPLTSIGGVLINIQDDFEFGQMTEESLEAQIHDGEDLLAYMSQTIEDFRNFFRPNKSKEFFDAKSQCTEAFRLLKDQLEYHNITYQIISRYQGESSPSHENMSYPCHGYPNEFKQVVINLISNAKDSICEKNISDGNITLFMDRTDQSVIMTVEDNGKGIPENILEKVFDPYFTTKHESQGTGLGLYMSKMIIEKNMDGIISLKNHDKGVKATITLPLSEKEKHD